MQDRRPLVLVILDGWGLNSRTEGNAITQSSTPNMDNLATRFPSCTVSISGLEVGLPEGQMGNSEVGHMHLGCGRIIYQDLTVIHRAIEDQSFFSNPVFRSVVKTVNKGGGRLHLMGLLGDGGVHSHQTHMEALIELARRDKVKEIYLHLFLDGRDTAPTSGEGFLSDLSEKLSSSHDVKIATLSGRYYAMDRDQRWDRIEKSFLALTEGVGPRAPSALEAVRKCYQDGITDEFVPPTVVQECFRQGMVCDGDVVIFFNFRADRARQLTRSFIEKDFRKFPRRRSTPLSSFVTMTQYDGNFDVQVAFTSARPKNVLGELVSRAGIHQLRLAETEKYAHVTYFFNGGEERKFPLEDRILIPSTKEVSTYDQKPAMSAYEITETFIKQIAADRYGLVVLNYANADMVGHTGHFEATVRACEIVDECVGRVVQATLREKGRMIITSDHGNAEQMVNYKTGDVHKAHTSNPVPLILVDEEMKSRHLSPGTAIDIAPTILKLLEIPQPPEMKGCCLIGDGS